MSISDYRVYLVLDPARCGGLDGMLRVARAALENGAGVVQLRAPTWKKHAYWQAARALQALCRTHGACFIVNDQVDVALAVNADGVHLGQDDLPVAEARRLLGPDAIIGLSVSNLAQLQAADAAAVDYFGVGPVFATATKPDAAPAMGLDALRAVVRAAGRPCVAIGGIDHHNAQSVLACGVAGLAVVSAICSAADPAAATRQLRQLTGEPT